MKCWERRSVRTLAITQRPCHHAHIGFPSFLSDALGGGDTGEQSEEGTHARAMYRLTRFSERVLMLSALCAESTASRARDRIELNWTARSAGVPWDARPEMRVMMEGRLMMRCVPKKGQLNGPRGGDRACDRG